MPKFIHDLRGSFVRFFSPPRDANFQDLARNTVPSDDCGEELLLHYQRYHWGSSPRPWY